MLSFPFDTHWSLFNDSYQVDYLSTFMKMLTLIFGIFVLGISKTDWEELLNDKRKPLLNKATSGAYPPGSTFKMIVAAAALC